MKITSAASNQAPATGEGVCKVCGRMSQPYAGGKMERATYTGAPKGGIPVHRDCLTQFYATLDKNTGATAQRPAHQQPLRNTRT